MTISPDTTVGELASEFPETIRVFQRLRIEFCCDGPRALGELCRERGLAFDRIAAALGRAAAAPAVPDAAWRTRPLVELTAHIIEAFHEPLRHELPRLHALALRAQNHGHGSRETLGPVLREVERLRADLVLHMASEDQELFPIIVRLQARDQDPIDGARFERLRTGLEREHAEFGQTLLALRRITGHYNLPTDACATVRGLYQGLEELDKLMQLHIHLENNVLFPRAAALLPGAGIERSQ